MDLEDEFFSLEEEFFSQDEPITPRFCKSDADEETPFDPSLDWLRNFENDNVSQNLPYVNLKKIVRRPRGQSIKEEEKEDFKSGSPSTSGFKFNIKIDSFFKKKQVEPKKEDVEGQLSLTTLKRSSSNDNLLKKLHELEPKMERKRSFSKKNYTPIYIPDSYDPVSYAYFENQLFETFHWEFNYNSSHRNDLESLQEEFKLLDEEDFTEVINVLYEPEEIFDNPLFEKYEFHDEEEILEEFVNPFYQNGNCIVFPKDWEFEKISSIMKYIKSEIKLEKVQIGSFVYKRCFSGKSLIALLNDYANEYMTIEDCKYILARLHKECWISSVPYDSNMEFEENGFYCFIEDDKHSDIINHTDLLQNTRIGSNWTLGHPRDSLNMALRIQNTLEKLYDECVNYEEGFIDFKTMVNNGWLKILNCESYYLRRIDFHDLDQSLLKPIFLNLYNLIFLHYCISRRIPRSIGEYEEMISQNCYMIGKYKFSLLDIRNILRGITKIAHPYLNDYVFQDFDPRIHFCLSGPFKSSPLPRVFTMHSYEREIQEATTRYITIHSKLNQDLNELYIPPIFTDNKIDFSLELDEIFDFIYLYIDKNKQKQMERMMLETQRLFHKYWSNFDWGVKEKEESGTNEGDSFTVLIQNPKFREIFKDYCKSEISLENVLFWETVQDYKNIALKNINSQDLIPPLLLDKSRIIYKDFLKRNSKYELNVEQNQVNSIYDIITGYNNNALNEISIHLFDDIEKSIVLVMSDTFMRFQMKKEYEIFIKDLQRQKLTK